MTQISQSNPDNGGKTMRILFMSIITLCWLVSLNVEAATTDSATLRLAAKGPGTQTEDELFIGARPKSDARKSAKPQDRQSKKINKAAKPRKTGDEDLDDLEVQRNRSRVR
jgi:hypothetical protein